MRIASLLDRARDLFAKPRPTRDATEAVVQDSFDRELFQELVAEAPALRDVIDRLSQDVDYADDVVRDTLMQFWKGDPRIRPQAEMHEQRVVQHAVAKDVADSDELADARRYTQHDRYGAAMATIGVTEKVHDYARKHGKAMDEARKQKEDAERAEQQAAKAAQDAAQAAQDAAGELQQSEQGDTAAPGEDGFHGPLSAEQEAAMQAAEQAASGLEEALANLASAQSLNDQATEALDAQAQAAQAALNAPVNEAVQEATEKLEDERALFAMWGVTDGQVQQMSFEERAALAAALKGNRMSEFANYIGRFKLMASAQRVKKVEYGRDQVVGTELSGDITRVTMTEMMALAMGDDDVAEMMELDFFRRLSEGQLLSRKFEGEEKVGKGAIIAALDSSGSMSNKVNGVTREAWSKAMALALFDAARRQNRTFVGILFSNARQISVHRFEPGKYQLPDVLEFASKFFGGGTNFEVPLTQAMDLLEDEFNGSGKDKGDLVFITDDECRVTPEFMRSYLERKERLGFRCFGIAVGMSQYGDTLAAVSDNVRALDDFVDPHQVQDIFQVI